MDSCNSGETDAIIARYQKMISDSFVLLFVYVFLAIVCIMGIVFIGKNLYKTIKSYIKYRDLYVPKADPSLGQSTSNPKDKSGDDEFYPVDPEEVQASYIPQEQNPGFPSRTAKMFYQDVDKKYSEYNAKKSSYIADVYDGRKNDDLVDKRVIYSKYDDYDY